MTETAAKSFMENRAKNDAWGRNKAAIDENKALANRLNAEARENWHSESWHRQVASDIADQLDYGFQFDNLFSQYIDTEAVGLSDRVILKERRGLNVFYTSRGGYIEESQLRTEMWEVPRDTLGFHVSEHTDKLLENFAETIADLVALGQARLESEVNRRILSLVQTSIPIGSSSYVATSALSKTDLDTAIRLTRDAVKPMGGAAVPVTVFGRASMIDGIAEFSPTFSPNVNEEVRQKGFIGKYKGAQVIVINNYVDEDNKAYLPGNELYVLGGTAGKFVTFGNLFVKTWDENTVDYRHYRARKDVGGVITHPEQVRRLVDASQSA